MTVLANRWLRAGVWFGGGLAAVALLGVWGAPQWPEVCDAVTVGKACEPVATDTAIGYGVIVFGIVVMLVGPIVTSVTELLRKGYDWETSRVETATSNLPILAGLLYTIIGIAVLVVG